MKKIVKNKFFPFLLLFIFMLFLHHFTPIIRDDVSFGQKLSDNTLWEFLSNRYNTWSSRLVIETFLVIFAMINMSFWRVIDSFLYTLTAYLVSILINDEKSSKVNYIICLLFLIYPFLDQSCAGWVATTTNYLWPFSLGLLALLPLILQAKNKKVNKIVYLFSILGVIYASNQEQMCAIIIGFNILYFLYNYVKYRKISIYNVVCFILSTSMLIFILTCPGNSVRFLKETQTWYPAYADYNVFQKLYLGIVPTMSILLSNKILICLLVTTLAYGTFVYAKSNFSRVIAIFSVILTSLLTIFQDLLISMLPTFRNILDILNSPSLPLFNSKASLIPLCISILLIMLIIYMLLVVFKKQNILPLFIFLAGFASRMIMGFSPTIFASSTRTAYFFYMAIIIVIAYVIYTLYQDRKINKVMDTWLLAIISTLALLNYIDVFLSM